MCMARKQQQKNAKKTSFGFDKKLKCILMCANFSEKKEHAGRSVHGFVLESCFEESFLKPPSGCKNFLWIIEQKVKVLKLIIEVIDVRFHLCNSFK